MEIRKSPDRWVGFAVASVLLMTVALAPSVAAANTVTLGNALTFAALSTAGDINLGAVSNVGVNPPGDVGGQNVTFSTTSKVGGDAIASPGNIKVGNGSTIFGTCVVDSSSNTIKLTPPSPGGTCGGMSFSDGSNLPNAISDVATFVTALLLEPATLVLPPINVKSFPHLTITETAPGDLNIFEVNGNVTLDSGSTLTLVGFGTVGDAVVLRIDGDLMIGDGAKITVQELSANQVIIYVGGTITWLNTTTVNGTLLVPNSPCAAGFGTTTINGAVICGNDVTSAGSMKVNFKPASLVVLP
jgi:hypothetical protein